MENNIKINNVEERKNSMKNNVENCNTTKKIKEISIKKLIELSKKTNVLIVFDPFDDTDDWLLYVNTIWPAVDILQNCYEITPEDCFTFVHDGSRYIYFDVWKKPINLYNLGRWRRCIPNRLECFWLSDFVANKLNRKEV